MAQASLPRATRQGLSVGGGHKTLCRELNRDELSRNYLIKRGCGPGEG